MQIRAPRQLGAIVDLIASRCIISKEQQRERERRTRQSDSKYLGIISHRGRVWEVQQRRGEEQAIKRDVSLALFDHSALL
jgi:hypothetical protein